MIEQSSGGVIAAGCLTRCYNAAMEAEPPQADLPKRKRRWFQFSLRTLLIGVTVLAALCAYVVHEAKIVSDRWATWRRINDEGGNVISADGTIPNGPNWIRLALHDRPVKWIYAPVFATDEEIKQFREMFPEAEIRPASDFEKRIARGEANPDPVPTFDSLWQKLKGIVPVSTSKPATK
jgi:hypothetical protein